MLGRLILIFVTVPLLELFLLLEIGQRIGLLSTVLLVIFTGILGAWLARRQGLEVLIEIQRELQKGLLPASAILEGGMILLAAGVLITPGILTDIFGFALLVPPVRRWIRRLVKKRMELWLRQGRIQVVSPRSRPGPHYDAETTASEVEGNPPRIAGNQSRESNE